MVAYTSRLSLPYPTTADSLSTVDDTLQSLAEAVDEKLDIRRFTTTGLKYAKNLAYYEEGSPNLAGYIVVQTNLTMGNYMMRFDFRGYMYSPYNNVVDLTVTAYAFQADSQYYNVDVSNKGTMQFSDIRLLTRTSDGKLAIALLPDTPSNLWQYPKMVVDAYVGHTEATNAQLSGWTLTRQANLSAWTFKKQALSGLWQALTFSGNWINYGEDWQTARFKKVGSVVSIQGLIKSGTMGSVVGNLPEGFRPGGGKIIFSAQTDTGQGRVDVEQNGNIVAQGGGTGYFSLSNIQFIAER